MCRSEKESFCRAAVASSRRKPSAERVWRRNRGGGRLRLAELDLAAQTYSAGTAATCDGIMQRVRNEGAVYASPAASVRGESADSQAAAARLRRIQAPP